MSFQCPSQARRKRSVHPINMRKCGEKAFFCLHVLRDGFAGGLYRKRRVALQKRLYTLCIFFRSNRTRGIHKQASRPNVMGSGIKEFVLQIYQFLNFLQSGLPA